MSSQQLADAAGESYDAIDHWTEKRLLRCTRRGRRRMYDRSQLARIKKIRALQDKNYSLDAIRDNLPKT